MQCVSLTLGQLKIIYAICFQHGFAYVAWESMQLCIQNIQYQNISTLVAPQSLNLHIQLHQIECSKSSRSGSSEQIESQIHKTTHLLLPSSPPPPLARLPQNETTNWPKGIEIEWHRQRETEIAKNDKTKTKIIVERHDWSPWMHRKLSHKAHWSRYLKF